MRRLLSFPSLPLRQPTFTFFFIALGAMLLAGCDDEDPGVTEVESSAETDAPDLQLPDQVRPAEAAFADLSRRVPSTAGFYFDNGRLVVLVRDSSDFAPARARVLSLARDGALGPEGRVADVTVKRADYSFRELARWRDLVFENILTMEGVNFLDLDEQANRIVIGLNPERAAQVQVLVGEALLELEIEPEAVEYVQRLPAVFEAGDSVGDRFDEIQGGIRWYHAVADTGCTIGFVATISGNPHMVTASHCSDEMWVEDGGDAGQPEDDNPQDYIGYEAIDVPG